jgi:hypothetical protein
MGRRLQQVLWWKPQGLPQDCLSRGHVLAQGLGVEARVSMNFPYFLGICTDTVYSFMNREMCFAVISGFSIF